MALSEFEIIREYFSPAYSDSDVVQGIGDDCAVVDVAPEQQLVMTTDTLASGVHFPAEARPQDIGHKALAVSLSDLASMGAKPRWVLLNLSLPRADAAWLEAFAEGFFAMAQAAEVQLIGGDTIKAPLAVGVQALGLVPRGAALLRSGAQAGDDIYVSGDLGGAGLGLKCHRERQPLTAELQQKFHRPIPRCALGERLRGIASACIDISDGLLQDLGHIAQASQVGAKLELERIPRNPDLSDLSMHDQLALALNAGDDYELCFTAAPSWRPTISTWRQPDCYRVGSVVAAPIGVQCAAADGSIKAFDRGYDHFRVS